jgi:hypothetical protein
MRRPHRARLVIVTVTVTVTACGGRGGGGGGGAQPVSTAAAAWTCPAGDEVAVDLDGDGADDQVRMAPGAADVTCLEVHATTAPTLVCDAARPPALDQLERADGRYQSTGTAPCDPMGARVRPIVAAPPDAPVAPRSPIALLAEAAPTGTALWLDGGDASAAITWHDGRWTWIAVGF